MSKKDVIVVMSYRGVENYKLGFYEGKNKDVLIVGAEISGEWTGRAKEFGNALVTLGTGTVSQEGTTEIYEDTLRKIQSDFSKINEAYVYLGKDGAGSGFEIIKKLMEQSKDFVVKLVACDCDAGEKVNFAEKYGLQIIWSECGGRETLKRIVNKILND